MSLTNIKLRKSEGFTIVELLIVVVVIAILAAITIVSYNGITNKANSSAAASMAATLQKKAELYASSEDGNGSYPTALSTLTGDSSKPYYIAPNTIKITGGATNPTSTNGKTHLRVNTCTGGLQIVYYDFENTTTKTINVGTTSSCSGNWAAA